MTLEKQVCSLELAKKLKELGVKQESYFVYCGTRGIVAFPRGEHFLEDVPHLVSAFTVAELGEMLPARVTFQDEHYGLQCLKHNGWEVKYVVYRNGIGYILGGYVDGSRGFGNEADARAKMLIYLLENKLITL